MAKKTREARRLGSLAARAQEAFAQDRCPHCQAEKPMLRTSLQGTRVHYACKNCGGHICHIPFPNKTLARKAILDLTTKHHDAARAGRSGRGLRA